MSAQHWRFAIKAPTIGMYGPTYTRVIGENLYTIYKRRCDNTYHYHVLNGKGKYVYRSEGDQFYKGDINPHNVIDLIESKAEVR